MTKEEYVEKSNILKFQTEQLKLEYIAANTKFAVGQKVEAFYNGKSEGFGIVKYVVVTWDSRLEYEVQKLKKDGSLSVFTFGRYMEFREVLP